MVTCCKYKLLFALFPANICALCVFVNFIIGFKGCSITRRSSVYQELVFVARSKCYHALLRSNLLTPETVCRHSKMREFDATLVGEDTQGNKYYEKKENVQFGMNQSQCYLLVIYILLSRKGK